MDKNRSTSSEADELSSVKTKNGQTELSSTKTSCNEKMKPASEKAKSLGEKNKNSPVKKAAQNGTKFIVKAPENCVNELVEDDDGESSSSASFFTEATGTAHADTLKNRQTRYGLMKKGRIQFKYSSHLKEDHGLAVFGAAFNYRVLESKAPVFATVGSNRITLYKCPSDGSLVPEFVHGDPDTDENFYTVAWSYLEENHVPVLAAAGQKGIIRLIHCYGEKPRPVKTFVGHGSAINDLKFHPVQPSLLFSASKDHGIRLWNIKTTALVAMFGGVEGHRDEVLGIDVHFTGTKFVSCGMDHSLKVWRLDVPEVEAAIRKSFGFKCTQHNRQFKTVSQHYPDYSTRDVHHNYVDCVSWFADSIVSKSCEHDVKLWYYDKANADPIIMTEIEVKKKKKSSKDVNIWYLKFGFEYQHTMLAVGDGTCKTHVYNMFSDDPADIPAPAAILSHPKCVSVVRVAAFSYDGDILITTCDDGSVFRWDRQKPGLQ